MAKYSGIFLIEDKALHPSASAESFLKTLQWYSEVQVRHRKAASCSELLTHVMEWAGGEDWVYSILYFWGHGSPNALWLGDEGNDQVSLDQISKVITDTWDWEETGRAGLVHFGACSTLRLTDDKFLRASGVAAISGYRADVDWIDSLAFEMLYMSRIQNVVTSEMERDKNGADVYLTPDVMNKVWKQLDKDDGPTRNLIDHLHFDLRIASSPSG